MLEHILIENLTSFYEVGEHNIMRLRGADWNDALDMAEQRGESVAFTYAYAGNLKHLARLLQNLEEKEGIRTVSLSEELGILLEKGTERYESADTKREILAAYLSRVQDVRFCLW